MGKTGGMENNQQCAQHMADVQGLAKHAPQTWDSCVHECCVYNGHERLGRSYSIPACSIFLYILSK